jgi:regulator of protease activity HflC (stomatin/prohibitin superfamily)
MSEQVPQPVGPDGVRAEIRQRPAATMSSRPSSTREVAKRVAIAGIEVVEVRISHLAHAPEIAQAMLRRQQAHAAARSRIVEGAVGMVEMALQKLSEQGVVELDEERRARLVSNLMVVLCGDQPPVPVVNAGTLDS